MSTPIIVQIITASQPLIAVYHKLGMRSAILDCSDKKNDRARARPQHCGQNSPPSVRTAHCKGEEVHGKPEKNLSRWFSAVRCVVPLCFRGRFPAKIAHLVAALTLSLLTALHNSTSSHGAEIKFMRIYGQTEPPQGFLEFCRKYGAECKSHGLHTTRFAASPQLLSELDEVNRLVNATIAPATDAQIYGVEEYWTFPKSVGDCEDYVVLKRRILMQRGWPASALLITVVIDERGDAHAVLTARTAYGDFILDNQAENVKLWTTTPYRFLMRQSYINPKVWVLLTPQAKHPLHRISGMRGKQQ